MVGYHEGTKGVSSGLLWQDSAVCAARLIEKYVAQEEQLIQLSDLHSTNIAEYDRSTGSTQLVVCDAVVDSVSVNADLSKIQHVGSLPGTSCLWQSVENNLRIWDSLDNSGLRATKFTASVHPIVCVGIAESRDSVSPSLLVVATTWDVSLFYFDPEAVCESSPPVLTGFVTATGGLHITSISTPSRLKRIFLGTSDGSVLELNYRLTPEKKSIFRSLLSRDRRCYLSIILRPLASMLPAGLQGVVRLILGESSSIKSVAADACRNLLFAISENNLRVFDLSKPAGTTPALLCDLPEYAIRTAVGGAFELVEVIASNPHVGGEVVCVLVTRSGGRIFVRSDKSGWNYAISPTVQTSACMHCRTVPAQLSSVSVLSVKAPDRHPQLSVQRAYSPDSGRTIVLVASTGLAVVRPDESCIAQRQNAMMTTASFQSYFQIREKFDFMPTPNLLLAALVPEPPVASTLQVLIPSDALLPTSTNVLGTASGGWSLVTISSEGRRQQVSIPTSCEYLVGNLRNMHAVREISLAWKPEQLAGQFFEILLHTEVPELTNQVSQLLFSHETATALGLIDLPNFDAPASANLLGGPAQTQQVSSRSRGLAILLGRILRPVWLLKAFRIQVVGNVVSLRPALSASQRAYFSHHLLGPTVALLAHHRPQLASSSESRVVEGFTVLVNALVEAMELFRLLETGQLTAKEIPQLSSPALLTGLSQLLVRDIVLSAGVGEPLLLELLAGMDTRLVRKHCPLLVPHERQTTI